MDTPMNHEEKKDMPMGPKHMHGHHGKFWSSWKSPVGLGFFFLTTALAFAILLYTILNLVVSVSEAIHPQTQEGMSAQDLQQLEEQSAPSSGTAMPTGTAAQ